MPISIEFPAYPQELDTSFEPPEDPDLLWISGANYLMCKLFQSLYNNSYKITQLTETDAEAITTGLQTYQTDMLAAIQLVYPSPEV